MKFQIGDIIIRNQNKPNAIFDSLINKEFHTIRTIERINSVRYYTLIEQSDSNGNYYFYPSFELDNMYDLGIKSIRKKKLEELNIEF